MDINQFKNSILAKIISSLKIKGLFIKPIRDKNIKAEYCNKCHIGIMVERKGKFGSFLSCNRFPNCNNTRNLK